MAHHKYTLVIKGGIWFATVSGRAGTKEQKQGKESVPLTIAPHQKPELLIKGWKNWHAVMPNFDPIHS